MAAGYTGDGSPQSPEQSGLNVAAADFQPGDPTPYLRGGFFNEELGWWVPFYVGRLKSFNMRTGYGFLECEKTFSIYRTDIYIHKSQVPIPWNLGASVEFAVTQNTRGQPQASDVNWLPQSAAVQDRTLQKAAPTPNAGGSSASAKNRHIGTLKSYSKMQGYGFISSEDIAQQHGSTDVYLDRGQLPGEQLWKLGQAVEFDLMYNHRGQPQARNVNWDPVPKLPMDTTMGAPGAAMGAGGVSLAALAGARQESQEGLRNLSKIQVALRSDKASAVVLAVELQEGSEMIDYIAYVLDRLGPPDVGINELKGSIPIQLLLALSKLLQKIMFEIERTAMSLSWCEEIISLLSKTTDGSSGDLKNLVPIVQENLEKARAVAANPTPGDIYDTQAIDNVIAKVGELRSSL